MRCAPFMAYCKPWPGVAEQLAQWQAVGARIGEPALAFTMVELCVMKCECDTAHACP